MSVEHVDVKVRLPHGRPPMRLCMLFRYQGVKYDDDGRWSVRICDLKGSTRKHVYLGSYLNEKKAASAYDRARIFNVAFSHWRETFVESHNHVMDI